MHFYNSVGLDCYVSILRTFRILFHWIVTLVSRAFLEFSLIGLLRKYLAYFQNLVLSDCYVSILRTFRILFDSIVTLVAR